jgi:hypothetical protein
MFKKRRTSPLQYSFLENVTFTMCFLLNLFFWLLSIILCSLTFFISNYFMKNLIFVFRHIKKILVSKNTILIKNIDVNIWF